MTNTKPCKTYEIMVDGTWVKAHRTRNTWNKVHTGKFLSYDQNVQDVRYQHVCTNPFCFGDEFIVTKSDIEYGEGVVFCDLCGFATVEKEEWANRKQILLDVLELTGEHVSTWNDKDDTHWMNGLTEEVSELYHSLNNNHHHTPERELKQIASIALNWLAKRKGD